MEAKVQTLETDDLKDLTTDSAKYGEVKLELIQVKQELHRAKEALQGQCYYL